MVGAVAKKAKFTEGYPARFVPGTSGRMEALLGPGEDRADFIRAAVEREIVRRARSEKGVIAAGAQPKAPAKPKTVAPAPAAKQLSPGRANPKPGKQ